MGEGDHELLISSQISRELRDQKVCFLILGSKFQICKIKVYLGIAAEQSTCPGPESKVSAGELAPHCEAPFLAINRAKSTTCYRNSHLETITMGI